MHSAAGLDKTWLRKDGRGRSGRREKCSLKRGKTAENKKIQVTKKNKVLPAYRGFEMEDLL